MKCAKLYEKVMIGKRTSYREHIPAPIVMPEIEQKQVVTLLTALVISMLISVHDQLENHSRLYREIKNVEDSVRRLAQLNCEPLDEHLVGVGVSAWNAAIYAMQEKLQGGQA